DGLADEAEDDDRGEDRERDGDRDDQGRAPRTEEEQDHQAGKSGGDDGFAHDSADGGSYEERLVADGSDFEAWGKGFFDLRQKAEHAFDHGERGGRAGFENAEKNAAVSVLANDVGLRDETVGDCGNVADVNHRTIDLLDGNVREALDGGGRTVKADVVFC